MAYDAVAGSDTVTAAVPLPVLTPFLSAFERASDHMVGVLVDWVADAFAARAGWLERVARDQTDVLDAIADMVELDVGALGQPLEDPEREARVQREAWRTASTWVTLALLWTLVWRSGTLRVDEWVPCARDPEAPRPPGGSSLAADDEERALEFAAEALTASNALRHGRSLFLRDTSVFVSSEGAAVTAQPIVPEILLHRRGRPENALPELQAGDDVWFANAESGRIEGPHRDTGPGRVTMSGRGELVAPNGLRLTSVTEGVWCYCRGS
ncbi:MAG: hypothetical protein M3389_09840 [Actinomycetota bacterium]|nr:hypothetical protein [Actinomycetota bacterium]